MREHTPKHRWKYFSPGSQRLLPRLRQQSGQALVEFAILLPVLILLILGILYFGRYENYSNQATQLSEQAARQASVDITPGTGTSLQTYIQAQATGELQAGSGDVTVPLAVYIYYPTVSNPSPGTVGSQVRACLTATVRLPFLGGATQLITQYATMRLEQVETASEWTPNTSWPASCPS
jgi:Flp pilus assembly protein TadG